MPLNSKIDAEAVLGRVMKEGPDALLTRGEAAALLASRVKDKRDTERTARNRIGTQLDRACERGDAAHHGGLARMADGNYLADEIAYWANLNYPGVFRDLPCRPRHIIEVCNDSFAASDSLWSETTPGSLEGRLVLIEQLREQIRQSEVNREMVEIERKQKLAQNLKGKKNQ